MPAPKKFSPDTQVEAIPQKFGSDVKVEPVADESSADQPGAISRFFSSFASPIKEAVGGVAKHYTPQSVGEMLMNFSPEMGVKRGIVDPAIEQGKQAIEAAKGGEYSLAAGHGLAALLPIVGPWAANVGEKVGTQVGEGDIAGAGGTVAGNVALAEGPKLALKGAGAAAGAVPKTVRAGLEAVTRTTPRNVADIVKATSAENAAEVAKAAEKTADQAEARKTDLKKHFEKSQEFKAAQGEHRGTFGEPHELTPAEAVSRMVAAARGVEQLDEPLRADLKKTRDAALQVGNSKYTTLNKALDPIQANPEFLPKAVDNAMQKIKGSDTEPTILRDMARKIERGDTVNYQDLQGYYSELGKELFKGTLPGDVYHAYDVLQEAVGDEMQRIAETKQMGGQLSRARQYWRNMKQTFFDPKSPAAKALKATERGGTVKAFQGKDRSGIEAVARYNSELANRLAKTRDFQTEAGARTPKVPAKTAPKLAPAKPLVVPKTTTLTPETLRAMKAANVNKAAESVRSPNRLASTFLGYDLLRNAFNALGHAADLKFGSAAQSLLKSGRDIAIRVGYSMGAGKMADLLEQPELRDALSKISDRDIAEIRKLPPDQQAALGSEFKPLIDAATARGIKVSPSLAAWVGGSLSQPPDKPKGVAAVLTP